MQISLSLIIDYLHKHLQVSAAVLFGSMAAGKAKADSDIEIVVLFVVYLKARAVRCEIFPGGWANAAGESLLIKRIFFLYCRKTALFRRVLPSLQKMAQFRNILVHDQVKVISCV